MEIKFAIARQETADKKAFIWHPAIKIDRQVYIYTMGFKSRRTAAKVAGEIAGQIEAHVAWWMRDHAFKAINEIPDVLVDVVS